jgi:hypothetical protein
MGFLLKIADMDRWIEMYEPVNVHDDEHESIMFETFGADLDRIKATPVHNVWTWVDTDDGSVIIEGYHIVDRIGYFITKVPWVDGLDYEVRAQTNV